MITQMIVLPYVTSVILSTKVVEPGKWSVWGFNNFWWSPWNMKQSLDLNYKIGNEKILKIPTVRNTN